MYHAQLIRFSFIVTLVTKYAFYMITFAENSNQNVQRFQAL
jgi:hypothetical protein